MVILYTGTPGSGKSYHATRLCHHATRKGVNVIANFVVDVKHKDRFFYLDNDNLTVQNLIDFANVKHKPYKESQTIIIIDEASILFNSRDFQHKDRMSWIQFFSQHRKLGYDIILVTQMDRSLDRQIRGMIELQYIHRKLTNFGWKGWILMVLFRKKFVCVHQWYAVRQKIGQEFFNVRKKIANSYNTYAIFDGSIDVSRRSDGTWLSIADQKDS
jgi:zona occludens toxin